MLQRASRLRLFYSIIFLFFSFFSEGIFAKEGHEEVPDDDTVLIDDVEHIAGGDFLKGAFVPQEAKDYQLEDVGKRKDPEYKSPIKFYCGGVSGKFGVRFRPETFFAKNANLLNSNNNSDKVFFNRSTVDLELLLGYGREFFDEDVVQFFIDLRHKVTWGNPATSVSTQDAPVKIADSVVGPHRHNIIRQFPWLRSVWMKFELGPVAGLSLENKHSIILGSFKFELGRGISLGSAFNVNPGVLGFYSENSIDNFAYGMNISGEWVDEILTYDLYGAILENLSDSFKNTSSNVRGQEFGRKLNQERGFGNVNFLIASRLQWVPVNSKKRYAQIQPYLLYNKAPEQTIEFTADSSAKLGTFGLAAEFRVSRLEFGFDTAFNTGQQKVRGWDRNTIELNNFNGVITSINSNVVTQDPTINPTIAKPKAPNRSANQLLVNNTAQSEANNGQAIGLGFDLSGNPATLYNDLNRFRNPYSNEFKGKMFVGDALYNFCDGEVKCALMVGYASGDEDPNANLEDPNRSAMDGDFKGFISLEEIYTGDRVKSAFLLGGAGRVPRPFSAPMVRTTLGIIPRQVSNFTNLVLIGSSVEWNHMFTGDRFVLVKPNFLAYWQSHATNKFDLNRGVSIDEPARTFLGLELNLFAEMLLLKDLKLYCVTSTFVPGGHYTDIKGLPLTPAQQKILDRRDKTGINDEFLPLLGNDTAFTINIGLELKF